MPLICFDMMEWYLPDNLAGFRACQSSLIPVRDFIMLISEGEPMLIDVSSMLSISSFGMYGKIILFMVITYLEAVHILRTTWLSFLAL